MKFETRTLDLDIYRSTWLKEVTETFEDLELDEAETLDDVVLL